jgi:hypothetical protein
MIPHIQAMKRVKRKSSVAAEAMLEELKGAARALGIEVREEELLRERGYRPRGGACSVGERSLILLDRNLAAADRLEVLCSALAGRDLDQVFLSPALRARLARRRPGGAATG